MKSVHANPPEKICRLCLSDSGVILPIFEGEVAERFPVPLPQKILSCLAIKVCADDPLPPHICHRCLYEVDRFHEFRETCKRTNTTFNKICHNSSDSVPFDVNQVLEIKQELHDESVYQDAISDLLSDEEGSEVGSSRIRKRNRCLSLIESMKRVQQAQTAASASTTPSDQLPAEWIEQTKTAPQSDPTSSSSHIRTQLECRFCAKPFIYENTLVEHEDLHAKGLVGEDTVEPLETLQVTVPVPVPVATAATVADPSSGQLIQQVEEALNPSSEEKAAHPSQETSSGVDTVTLTDVTAMLLEGAFEGVRTSNTLASSQCRFCQEEFSNPDLLRRHERMYCNRKPSLIKLRQQMQHHPQSTHQSTGEAPLSSEQHIHPPESHHLMVHQTHETQTPQAEQQINFSQKGGDESNSTESNRSCKHCHKDFIHRGSLWRHQMFCDSNPDRDINRIVAGTKKKSSVVKNCDLRSDLQHHMNHSVVPLHNSVPSTSGSHIRRSGLLANSGPFKCKFCEKRFLHRGSWWRHQKMFCSVNPEIPSVKAESKTRNHQGISTFACRYCDRTFLHRGSCWHHEQTHTGMREHACRYCSKTFNEKSRVARHERMHLGIKPFSCRQCGKSFCDASNLRNHEQIHGERASFLCAWCGKSYTRRALLLKHEQVHAGEGQIFSCASCPRTFPDPDTLNEHSMIHAQEKKKVFLCQTCGQTFRSQILLSQHNHHSHMNVPHRPQPQQVQHIQQPTSQTSQEQEQQHHSCNICNKVFTDVSSLQHHELLHSSAPVYRCSNSTCNAVFHERSQLDAHLIMHEGEKTLSVPPSVSTAPNSGFHQHQHSQHQQLLATHEIQHHQTLQHHDLLHREGTYVIEGQNISGQSIAVHHIVSQLPQ